MTGSDLLALKTNIAPVFAGWFYGRIRADAYGTQHSEDDGSLQQTGMSQSELWLVAVSACRSMDLCNSLF